VFAKKRKEKITRKNCATGRKDRQSKVHSIITTNICNYTFSIYLKLFLYHTTKVINTTSKSGEDNLLQE